MCNLVWDLSLTALLCPSTAALQYGYGRSGCCLSLRWPRASFQPLPALQHLLLRLPAVPQPISRLLEHLADHADQRCEQLGQQQQPGLVQQPPRHSLHALIFTHGLALFAHTPWGRGQPEQRWGGGGSYLQWDTWRHIAGLTLEESK